MTTTADSINRLPRAARRGFTIIELLIVLAIVGILIGLLLPTLVMARRKAHRVACQSNLKQLGYALQMYTDANATFFPLARAIPEPFLTTDTDPPLPHFLDHYMTADGQTAAGLKQKIYHCPADSGDVFARCGISYQYDSLVGGQRVDQLFLVQMFNVSLSEVWVARDFDGGTFDLTGGGQVEVPFFHDLRNLLFADWHVGNFEP